MLKCPICGDTLTCVSTAFRCENGHAFDIAKEGYVNLLPSNRKRVANPGDNRQMVAARAAFLEKGYYKHLSDLLAGIFVEQFSVPNPVLLDSGCGEGYYTSSIYQALLKIKTQAKIIGIDLSKEAARRAAKRIKDGVFAVASVYHLPIADASVNGILNCFSPMSAEEFSRVLCPGGFLVYVVPAEKHLWQLKNVLYDTPYPNTTKAVSYPGFTLEAAFHTEEERLFADNAAICDLFQMTPYAYRTPAQGIARMQSLDSLVCTCAFDVYLYRREK